MCKVTSTFIYVELKCENPGCCALLLAKITELSLHPDSGLLLSPQGGVDRLTARESVRCPVIIIT